jgi:branched-chain amino acid transport system substrate-binding protein
MIQKNTTRRDFLQGSVAAAAAALMPFTARAAENVKVGLILPLTGPFASTGRQVEAAARLFFAQHGDTVNGQKIELLIRDDTGLAPETTKRIAQELISRDKITFLAGFGLTPLALATAPVATEAKIPMVVTCAATSIIPQRSPFIVRSGFTVPQITWPMAEWATKNGITNVVTMVTDYAPGLDCEKVFIGHFGKTGKVLESLRTPLQNPDYAPFLQRAKDAKPDALFLFVPSGQGAAVMKQFVDRGLKEAGIKLICTGDVLDDDLLEAIGPSALGVVSSHHYSAAHDSPENKAYVSSFMKANNFRPNFMSLGGYDGMRLITEMLKKANTTDGEKLVDAAKGQSWVSPRGRILIDAESRDIVQDIYIRRCEQKDGKLWNVEFDKIEKVKPI